MNIFKPHKHTGINQPNTTPVGNGTSVGKATGIFNGTNSMGPGAAPQWQIRGAPVSAVGSPSNVGAQFGTRLSNLVTFTDMNGNEILRVEPDGKVVWAAGYQIDSAAEAFSRSLYLGAEKAALVTQGTKKRMRDSVFEEIIAIINEDGGSITADELTRYWQAAKIIDKLKGDNE